MTNDLVFFESRFARWCANREALSLEQMQALRKEALGVLVESINAGEIPSLDGIDTPLSKTIKAYHRLVDFEMNSNWIGSSQDWVCPCCSRSKFQVSRCGKKGQILAKLVVHHDHMGDALKAAFHAAFEKAGTDVEQTKGSQLVERMGKAFAAHEHVLVCEDCNNADTEAKKHVSAPPFFSFTLGQIRRFIQSIDHQPHQIELQNAQQVWQEARPAYDLRMKLIQAVAHAAATDSHWYEPYPRNLHPVPVLGNGHRVGDAVIQRWVSGEALYRALGPQTPKGIRNLSRWRTTAQKPGRPLPSNFLAMLRSSEKSASSWAAVPDDWRCPICRRTKQEAVYIGDNGKVCFHLSSNRGNGPWAVATKICNHCSSILMSLKLEVSDLIGTTPRDSYDFVSPDELASLIVARPHSPHSIRSKEAAALVATIVHRLT